MVRFRFQALQHNLLCFSPSLPHKLVIVAHWWRYQKLRENETHIIKKKEYNRYNYYLRIRRKLELELIEVAASLNHLL
jgi:hypothetical protein